MWRNLLLLLISFSWLEKQDLKNNGIPYLSICPAQGSFLLCEHIVKKNIGQFIWLLIKNIWKYFNSWLKIRTIIILEIKMEIHSTYTCTSLCCLVWSFEYYLQTYNRRANRLKSKLQIIVVRMGCCWGQFDVLTQGGFDQTSLTYLTKGAFPFPPVLTFHQWMPTSKEQDNINTRS